MRPKASAQKPLSSNLGPIVSRLPSPCPLSNYPRCFFLLIFFLLASNPEHNTQGEKFDASDVSANLVMMETALAVLPFKELVVSIRVDSSWGSDRHLDRYTYAELSTAKRHWYSQNSVSRTLFIDFIVDDSWSVHTVRYTTKGLHEIILQNPVKRLGRTTYLSERFFYRKIHDVWWRRKVLLLTKKKSRTFFCSCPVCSMFVSEPVLKSINTFRSFFIIIISCFVFYSWMVCHRTL